MTHQAPPGTVHQLLHGYRRGHERLAGSVRLPAEAAELITRLSDLSGTLAGSALVAPYLTGYPLPGGAFYALARTWPDRGATRDGCVLTHTLLIPTEAWALAPSPLAFAALFRVPADKEDTEPYREPLPASGACPPGPESELPASSGLPFVIRFFHDGLRPLVWLDERHAEDMTWRILGALWPSLRVSFSFCTYCLQPRSLGERALDLMFAPGNTYPRYSRLPREHVLKPSEGAAVGEGPVEDWCLAWAGFIFGGTQDRASLGPFGGLVRHLEDDPVAIRRFFRINELLFRSQESPTAGVGMLDLVESLVPEPAVAGSEKNQAIHRAIQAAAQARDAEGALRSLFLIGERLCRPAFTTTAADVAEELAAALAASVSHAPELAFRMGEPLLAVQDVSRSRSPHVVEGLHRGFTQLARLNPAALGVLRSSGRAAAGIIARDPQVAAAYLQAFRTQTDALADLTRWISGVGCASTRKDLRWSLLPQLGMESDGPLVAELLQGIGAAETAGVLDVLCRNTQGFELQTVRRAVEDELSRQLPGPVRSWGRVQDSWTPGIALVMAATYPPTAQGLEDLLHTADVPAARQAMQVAGFLQQVGLDRYPGWLVDFFGHEPRVLVQLLGEGRQTSAFVGAQVGAVLREVRDAPVARVPGFVASVEQLAATPYFPALLELAARSAVREFVSGEIGFERCRTWLEKAATIDWLAVVPSWELGSLLAPRTASAECWARAWQWCAMAPPSLYHRTAPALPDIVDALLAAPPGHWPTGVAEAWVAALERARQECAREVYLQLASQALRFAISHTHYPVSSLVVTCFADVYASSITVSPLQAMISDLLGLFGWDKGKELREELTNSFYRSDWPPGDLALAVRDPALLRKIFKRIVRKGNGHHYVRRMIADLGGRGTVEANEAKSALEYLGGDPEFLEEWD